jgi:hypothetical protein
MTVIPTAFEPIPDVKEIICFKNDTVMLALTTN